MKKRYISILILVLVFLVACNDETKENERTNEMIDVSIKVPQTINQNEEVDISAIVTQDGEEVTDANEVVFEIRKSGQNEGEMIKGTHAGNGIYKINKSFEESGSYVVVAHVTARNMHNMPSTVLLVGNETQSVSHDEHSTVINEHVTETHTKDYAVFTFSNQNKNYATNDEVTLSTTINYGDKLLSGGHVLFEIWKENRDEEHEFIEAVDQGSGKYTATKSFDSSGTYKINIHVEKDDIHEHYLSTIHVQ